MKADKGVPSKLRFAGCLSPIVPCKANMPLPQRWNKNKKPPTGFEVIEPTLEALEHELRDKIKETNEKLRKTESMWPVHQINWQKSRYVYDMYYKYNRISKQVYQYCIQQKLIDAALIAKVRFYDVPGMVVNHVLALDVLSHRSILSTPPTESWTKT